ncbi:hypothetical protein JTB14_004632 [Gonioctena quinquepunctata]|nr:hypothetical protein JTB14_004632 [Gonioctena quinquepunctata]
MNLSKIACALRTGKHETTNYSPYFVNFGRHMILNGEDHQRLPNVLTDTDELPQPRGEGFQKLFSEVKQRLKAAASRNAKTYILRRRNEEFLPNQLVWRKNVVLSSAANYYSAKLAPKFWHGGIYQIW